MTPQSYPDTEEREALRRLYNEVSGCWNAFQCELREAISNTNYAVVQHKLDAAKAILDFPAPPSVPAQGVQVPFAEAEKLADWLKHMQGNFDCIAHDPIVKDHIAFLKRSEEWIRSVCGAESNRHSGAVRLYLDDDQTCEEYDDE